MIPLRDSIPASRRPVVTYTILALCVIAFLMQLADPTGELTERLGMVPARVLEPDAQHVVRGFGRPHLVAPSLVPDWLTLVTNTFLHGGWLHLLGNMLFLWIFGDNVEDRFGRVPFAVFYLVGGAAASASHLISSPDSPLPAIGASGAIAGVMGAYMLLYPRSRVEMLVFFGFVFTIVLPAPFFLGYWFVLQLVQGAAEMPQTGGGVAWWAHIGGFVFGAAVAGVLRATEHLRPEPPTVVLSRQRWGPRWPR